MSVAQSNTLPAGGWRTPPNPVVDISDVVVGAVVETVVVEAVVVEAEDEAGVVTVDVTVVVTVDVIVVDRVVDRVVVTVVVSVVVAVVSSESCSGMYGCMRNVLCWISAGEHTATRTRMDVPCRGVMEAD